MSTTRRKFTPEYRREAARLVIDTGRPVASVARELGLGEQLLGRWVAQERARLAAPEESAAAEAGNSELERLRRENAQLRMDNEFLGKAAAYVGDRCQVPVSLKESIEDFLSFAGCGVPLAFEGGSKLEDGDEEGA